MPKIKNVSGEDRYVPVGGVVRLVLGGEVFDVEPGEEAGLICQEANWRLVKKTREGDL